MDLAAHALQDGCWRRSHPRQLMVKPLCGCTIAGLPVLSMTQLI